jgi:hypothetical protein
MLAFCMIGMNSSGKANYYWRNWVRPARQEFLPYSVWESHLDRFPSIDLAPIPFPKNGIVFEEMHLQVNETGPGLLVSLHRL